METAENEAFCSIVARALETDVSAREVAMWFEVAESTVLRWASGVARPHPSIRASVVAKLRAAHEAAIASSEPGAPPAMARVLVLATLADLHSGVAVEPEALAERMGQPFRPPPDWIGAELAALHEGCVVARSRVDRGGVTSFLYRLRPEVRRTLLLVGAEHVAGLASLVELATP